MLPHSGAPDPSGVVSARPNKSAAGQICGKSVDAQQHHCYGCRYGGGVDRRHAAVARCLAGVIHSHNGTKVYIEKAIPALNRVVNGQVELARMDLVFGQNGTTTHLDVAIVSPFSSSPARIAAASTRPGHMANAFTQTHSSAQDASTRSSWTILPRRRIRSKKRYRTADPRLDTEDSYAGPPLSPLGALPLLCPCFVLLTLCGSSWSPAPSRSGSAT